MGIKINSTQLTPTIKALFINALAVFLYNRIARVGFLCPERKRSGMVFSRSNILNVTFVMRKVA